MPTGGTMYKLTKEESERSKHALPARMAAGGRKGSVTGHSRL